MKKLFLLSVILSTFFLYFTTTCKTADDGEFNIVGKWNWSHVDKLGITTSGTVSFTGTKTSGTVVGNIIGGYGDYTVTGVVVTITTYLATYNGVATDSKSMNGTYKTINYYDSGTWSATKK